MTMRLPAPGWAEVTMEDHTLCDISVGPQDIKAPEKLIWDVITDLDNYPKMVEGCDVCETYRREEGREREEGE